MLSSSRFRSLLPPPFSLNYYHPNPKTKPPGGGFVLGAWSGHYCRTQDVAPALSHLAPLLVPSPAM